MTEWMTTAAEYLIRLPAVLIALTVHECAHGYLAYKMGDPTARNLGRLTLNPLKHLDPIGFICMLLFRFGWAKPVPINARNFKKPKQGMALTALAGPASNFILSFVGYFVFRIAYTLIVTFVPNDNVSLLNFMILLLDFLQTFYILNLSLAIFNLIPVPPLDGSRILLIVLPDNIYFGLMKYEKYIMIAMLVLLYTGLLTKPLSYLIELIIRGFDFIAGLIPFLL